MSTYAQYILMRTDILSLTPGKAMAQAAHAADALSASLKDDVTASAYNEWKSDADGFGTCLVFDGGSWDDIMDVARHLTDKWTFSRDVFHCVQVLDPTYPIRDGSVTHLIPLHTCAIIFGTRSFISPILQEKGFKLYR